MQQELSPYELFVYNSTSRYPYDLDSIARRLMASGVTPAYVAEIIEVDVSHLEKLYMKDNLDFVTLCEQMSKIHTNYIKWRERRIDENKPWKLGGGLRGDRFDLLLGRVLGMSAQQSELYSIQCIKSKY